MEASAASIDVLIIGAGPIGSALGLALAQRGVRTQVVEAGPPREAHSDERGLALSLASLRILSALGLADALRRLAYGVRSVLVTDQGGPGVLELSAEDAELPALGGVITASALQQALSTAVRAVGADALPLHYHTTVESIEVDPAQARVRLSGPEAKPVISARLVVLADGGRSPLRQQLGFQIDRHDFRERVLVTNLRPHLHPGDRALELLTRSGPLAVLPRSEGRVTIVRCLQESDARRALGLNDGDWLAELEQALRGRLGKLSDPTPRSDYPLVRSQALPACRQRVLLIGAAERTLHPNGAQGFNLGLRDVAGLADVLEDCVQEGADPGALATLAHYQRERSADQAAVARFSNGLHFAAGLDFPGAGLIRGAGMLSLGLCRPLRRALILQTAGLAGRQSRLLRAAHALWPPSGEVQLAAAGS